jgi:hypothetical protein
MARILGGLVGIVMALFPVKFLMAFENLAAKNPDKFHAKRWLVPYVRTEGLLVALLCLAGGRAYALVMKFIGVVGVIQFLFPKQYVEFGFRLAYEQPDMFEWKRGFLPAVRVIGAFCILLAFRALKQPAGIE